MDAEIYRTTTPQDTILVVPRTLEYVYDRASDGSDVIGIQLDDKRIRPGFVALTPTAAHHIAAHLTSMVNNIGGLRREYERRNPVA